MCVLTNQSVVLIPAQYNELRFTIAYVPTGHAEGRLYYDAESKTLALQTDVTDVTLQIGQEQYLRARNNEGAQIDNGEVVYISGSTGDIAQVKLAKADAAATAGVIGVATEDIANNADGYITTFGIVRDIDTSAFAAGTEVYLSPGVAGAIANVKPVAPDIPVIVGTIIRQHATQGQLFVNVVRSI